VESGEIAILNLGAAIQKNQMIRLGDLMIGTRSPLRFRVEVEQIGCDGDRRRVVIRDVRLFCEHRHITTEVERRIALLLMLYGESPEEEIVLQEDGVLTAVEYRFSPPEENRKQDQQGFDMNTSISSMISRFFRGATVVDGKVSAFRVDFAPGEFGRLIPEDYDTTRTALPLWRFELQYC
jgi:hypothetical protein